MYFIVDPQKLKPTTRTLLRDSTCRHKSLSLNIMHFVGLNLCTLTIIVSLCQHRFKDWSFSEAHCILYTVHLCENDFCFPQVLGSHYKVVVYILTTWSWVHHYSIGNFTLIITCRRFHTNGPSSVVLQLYESCPISCYNSEAASITTRGDW